MRVSGANQLVAPVVFGMAGIVYLDDRGTRRSCDESWLTKNFRMTPWTTRTEWRGDDVAIVTCQHAHEAKTLPGVYQRTLPCSGNVEGLAFGHFFEVQGDDLHSGSHARNLLETYCASGSVCFRRLNGAWASVVWDRRKREALFARDVTGSQILYVAPSQERIAFATDLRLLLKSGLLGDCELDEQAMAEFLHYLYIAAPRSLVRGVCAVIQGHVLTIGASMRQQRYAPSRFVSGPKLYSEEEINSEIERQLPEFERRLLDAVADCIPPQGRVALTLSGGKDSSTLAVALSKLCPDRVLALTVGQSDRGIDESSDAALVCRALGLEHQSYTPTDEELARGIYDFIMAQDQPIGDPAALPYFLGMSKLPEDCTVILDGSGTDYYFGLPGAAKGILHYKRRAQMERHLPAVARKLLLIVMSLGPAGVRRLSQLWSRPVEESFVPWDGWSSDELKRLLNREVSFADTYLWQVMRHADPDHWIALHTENVDGIWSPYTAFRKSTNMAHALGKAIRFPFIDARLAVFINGLPEQLKYRNGVNKQLLRAYMKKNLPREIVEKPKSGFIFDLNRLLANPAYRWVEDLRRDGKLLLRPTWRAAPVERLLKKYAKDPMDRRWQQRLYALCLLATLLAARDTDDSKLSSAA